ncbi:MAG: thiopurine S-methyltransferase [Woeseiaceae bacterium]|nr:thiopurine S-methyltransferase [Woeseiaceae bacterium]
MNEGWLERWEVGRIGWHEPAGNQNLKAHWSGSNKRVLVPLCGKTPDLLWLEAEGNEVVGVEVSPLAARDFFHDNGLDYVVEPGALPRYVARERRVTIACGDFFEFREQGFDACYDRGALVAIDPERHADYVAHIRSLLTPEAYFLLIAVEYDQSVAPGPPFCLDADAVRGLLPGLECRARVDDLANCPPKFHEAGLAAFHEAVWSGVLSAPR